MRKPSVAEQRVLDVVEAKGGATTKQISDALYRSVSTVSNHISALRGAGWIEKRNGKWQTTEGWYR